MFLLSDDLKNSDVRPQMALSNAYRMWELPEGRNYFQEFFEESNHAFVGIFC